jgi:hypothetical protein
MKGVNHYLVELESALNEVLTTPGGFKLIHAGAGLNYNWNVTVTGKLLAKPSFDDSLNVGDDVAFSYSVVEERNWDESTQDCFHPLVEREDYKEWYNGKGQMLKMEKMPLKTNEWLCAIFDERKEILDTYLGRYGECENWISQFKFNNENYTHKNFFDYGEKGFWKVSKEELYVSVSDGKIKVHNGYVLLDLEKEDLTKRMEIMHGIVMPYNKMLSIYQDRGRVVASNCKHFSSGDLVGFNPLYCEKYQFWGKNYYLVKEKYITAGFAV